MNPMQIVQMMRNPKESIMYICKNTANPILNELVSKANEGDMQYLENFFRNVYKEKGLNFDEEMAKSKALINQFK